MLGGGDVWSADKAEELLKDGFDLIYVGRAFITNPDLIEKFKTGKELSAPDVDKLYTPGPEGYTDWE